MKPLPDPETFKGDRYVQAFFDPLPVVKLGESITTQGSVKYHVWEKSRDMFDRWYWRKIQ